jgi:hypothetical protein
VLQIRLSMPLVSVTAWNAGAVGTMLSRKTVPFPPWPPLPLLPYSCQAPAWSFRRFCFRYEIS